MPKGREIIGELLRPEPDTPAVAKLRRLQASRNALAAQRTTDSFNEHDLPDPRDPLPILLEDAHYPDKTDLALAARDDLTEMLASVPVQLVDIVSGFDLESFFVSLPRCIMEAPAMPVTLNDHEIREICVNGETIMIQDARFGGFARVF
ncbi:MAG: hypothetical protein V1908_04275 [Candidatus Peregrinibacteria bacterium]